MSTHQPMRSLGKALLAAAALASLAACDRKPEGQVIAVVNGDEITAQEMNAELGALPAGQQPDQQVRNAALNQVIDRRLLADVARDEGIEKSPEYILRKKKLEETLLVEMMGEKLVRDLKKPTDSDLQQVMATNPQAFANRTVYAVDQIAFRRPERGNVTQALAETKTMEEVVSVLNRLGVKFQRGRNAIDSMNMPVPVAQQLSRVGTSEPLILPMGQAVVVMKVLEMKQSPIMGEQAKQLAANAFSKQAVGKALKERLDKARAAGKIEYQSGYSALDKNAQGMSDAMQKGAAPAAGAAAPAAK